MKKDIERNSLVLLQTLHTQFSENQNHHQKIFIQLIIALFGVFAALGYVFINTKSIGEICSGYSNFVMYITSLIANLVLLFLTSIVIQNGYSFRRDQCITYNIRRYFIKNNKKFEKIFGTKSYNPYKNNNEEKKPKLYDFLPDFHYIVFFSLLVFQIIIIITCFTMFFKDGESGSWDLVIILFVSCPIICSSTIYKSYFEKYLNIAGDLKKRSEPNEF